jgi:membrane-associated phospholipid phosphatase
MRPLLWLKIFSTAGFMCLFFLGYFFVLQNPAFAVTQMPLTALDRLIVFYPPALIAYVSLWFYVTIPPALLLTTRELLGYGLWLGGLCVVGLTCFVFWPTAVAAHPLEWGQQPGFHWLDGVDAAGNACPSLHVGTAVFSAIWLDRLLGEMGSGRLVRAINWAWFVAIAVSTLAIKQHVVLDVAGGLLLGVPIALLSLRSRVYR